MDIAETNRRAIEQFGGRHVLGTLIEILRRADESPAVALRPHP